MPAISRVATRGYYRFSVGGARVPAEGPVLLVANHNNGLMDPAFVVVAAEREVRFMAKAPLITHPYIGWLVRAVGSIPVYRVQDDPKLVGQNRDIFVAVHQALAEGSAVGIFPEGTSHSGARLRPLKTGAARIALGAAKRLGHAFPIIPVGLVYRDRNSLRSEARVMIGEPFDWSDLAARDDVKFAVRELTIRIDEAMRGVTLNLDSWEDAALVHIAERVWAAEHASPRDSESTVSRLTLTASVLQKFRLRGDAEWQQTARELHAHARMLQRMGLTPEALKSDVSWAAALRWAIMRLPLMAAVPLASAALLAWWPPVAAARWVARHNGEGPDSESTFRVLGLALFGTIWTVLTSAVAAYLGGWMWGVAAFLLMPAIGVGAALVSEQRRLGWISVQRFFVRHLHRRRLGKMRQRQRMIAAHLNELLEIGTQ
jgi:1-acyl-sn-glycerol-3-phosphate acyltransferase